MDYHIRLFAARPARQTLMLRLAAAISPSLKSPANQVYDVQGLI